MEAGVYWRFVSPKEVQRRTVTKGQAVSYMVSVHLLEVMAMMMTACVMLRHEKRETG